KMPKIPSSGKLKRKVKTTAAEKVDEPRRSKRISERKLNKKNDEKTSEDELFEEMLGDPFENDKDFSELVADLPECQTDVKEYDRKDEDLETKVWAPLSETDEEWFPFYIFMARSALTFAQQRQHGTLPTEAMKNACFGYADHYIRDVLHESNYKPDVALKTLITREVPSKIFEDWSVL
ncbi:unnamed protein product, partial [Heterotrigona itama]